MSIPGAIEVWAHPLNYYGPLNPESRRVNGKVLECHPVALVYHTPEEDADDYEGTPAWFRNPDAHASTRWYGDNDGDLYQMVPEPWGAIANGLDGKPYPHWATVGLSLNLQTDNIEIEGRAHSLHKTMTRRQWECVIDWSVDRCVTFGIEPTRSRLVGHYELSTQRSDPGPWLLEEKNGLHEEVRYRVTEIERKIKELGQYVIEDRMKLNAHTALDEAVLPPLVKGDATTAEARLRFIYAAAGKAFP